MKNKKHIIYFKNCITRSSSAGSTFAETIKLLLK